MRNNSVFARSSFRLCLSVVFFGPEYRQRPKPLQQLDVCILRGYLVPGSFVHIDKRAALMMPLVFDVVLCWQGRLADRLPDDDSADTGMQTAASQRVRLAAVCRQIAAARTGRKQRGSQTTDKKRTKKKKQNREPDEKRFTSPHLYVGLTCAVYTVPALGWTWYGLRETLVLFFIVAASLLRPGE